MPFDAAWVPLCPAAGVAAFATLASGFALASGVGALFVWSLLTVGATLAFGVGTEIAFAPLGRAVAMPVGAVCAGVPALSVASAESAASVPVAAPVAAAGFPLDPPACAAPGAALLAPAPARPAALAVPAAAAAAIAAVPLAMPDGVDWEATVATCTTAATGVAVCAGTVAATAATASALASVFFPLPLPVVVVSALVSPVAPADLLVASTPFAPFA